MSDAHLLLLALRPAGLLLSISIVEYDFRLLATTKLCLSETCNAAQLMGVMKVSNAGTGTSCQQVGRMPDVITEHERGSGRINSLISVKVVLLTSGLRI